MAFSATYSFYYLIDASGVTLTPPLTDGAPFELSDADPVNPDNFTLGEPISSTTTSGTIVVTSATYIGFIAIDGTNYPVLENSGGSVRILFTNVGTFSSPGQDLGVISQQNMTTCLGPDVLISTTQGLCRVDQLVIGDQILSPDGPQRIKFIGRSTRFLPDLLATGRMPVVIELGALGELGPSKDLICSPSHAFLIDGVLVEAQALINGSSIHQLDSLNSFQYTYYSIELEDQSLVWANGVLTETYYANTRGKHVSREAWDNYADYVALYGVGNAMQELPHPRIPFQRQLPAEIRALVPSAVPSTPDDSAYTLV